MSHKHKHEDHEHKDQPPQQGQQAGQPQPQQQPPAEDLAKQLADLKTERDDFLSRLQRVSADFINYQKRSARDLELAREFANEELIKSLLYVLDDMERALDAARTRHPADDPMIVGMELVHKKMLETLGRFGLVVIDAKGLPFDPERHLALLQQPSSEHPAKTVLQELQKGYQLKGRTIRPTHVVVSTEPPAEENQGEKGQ